ncbi:MAG: hypothetical protein WKF60_04775 [Ilumatobacter sp.]
MPDPIVSQSSPSESTIERRGPPPLAAPTHVSPVAGHPRPPRPGDMSLGWRTVTAATWICVILALAAVWNASVQLGLTTWWLGPRGESRPRIVQVGPFLAPVLMVLAAVNQVRWLPAFGVAAAGVIAAVGLADVGRVTSLATIEIVIAIAAAVVSLASLAGVYRRVGTADTDPDATAAR